MLWSVVTSGGLLPHPQSPAVEVWSHCSRGPPCDRQWSPLPAALPYRLPSLHRSSARIRHVFESLLLEGQSHRAQSSRYFPPAHLQNKANITTSEVNKNLRQHKYCNRKPSEVQLHVYFQAIKPHSYTKYYMDHV